MFSIRDHYYEPLFRTDLLKTSLRRERVLPAVDFNVSGQLELLRKFNFAEELLEFPLNAYLLEAFLSFNKEFLVVGALNYLRHNHTTELIKKCPVLAAEIDSREPGLFWMRRA